MFYQILTLSTEEAGIKAVSLIEYHLTSYLISAEMLLT